jgi:hypothetical protein
VAVRTRVSESSRAGRAPVKGWQRHLEGWQAGALAVFIAGTGALLAVPRAVPPSDIPEPAFRPRELEAVRRADAALADDIDKRAHRGELDLDVRELGKAVGLFGIAEGAGNVVELEKAHRRIAERLHFALARGAGEVLALRAHQARTFLREMHAFERSGIASQELVEVAGAFPASLEARGWYDRAARRLAPDDTALTVMFKKRWNDLVGVSGPAFAVSLDEERARLAFLIAHPSATKEPPASAPGSSPARAAGARDKVASDEKRLAEVQKLAQLDPEYPALFAEGVLRYRLGQYERAASAFDRYLTRHPEGPLTIRARNFLKASLEAR